MLQPAPAPAVNDQLSGLSGLSHTVGQYQRQLAPRPTYAGFRQLRLGRDLEEIERLMECFPGRGLRSSCFG
ncbi:hypothetical protein pipiens_011386 [Culex pipiens pipiens]|uniref:Uncharacterized protein n=1 Tax=Culex pipiens pipiens TaxID=38569 RepID=A0ABD1D6M3_CULPP